MAYAPTKNVIDTRFIGENIIQYCGDVDAEVLYWANGDAPMDEFKAFYTNANGRRQTVFPSMMILGQSIETSIKGDILIGEFDLVFEIVITDASADEATRKAKVYQRAVESMLENIPRETLCANADPVMDGVLMEVGSTFDLLATQGKISAFVQVFNTRAKYGLTCAAY